MEVRQVLDALKIALIELTVLGLKNGVVRRLTRAGRIGLGVFLHDGGLAGQDLASHILELSDARVILARGVVDGAHGLELIHIERLELHVERTVRQGAQVEIEQLVERTGVDDLAAIDLTVDLDGGLVDLEEVAGVHVAEHINQIVVEHMLKQRGIAVLRHALEGSLREVAVIIAHKDGNTAGDRGINLVGRLAPLLHGVMQKDVLVDVISDLGQVGVVLLTQLHNGHLDILAKGLHELLIQLLAALVTKGELETRVVEGHGHKGAVDVGEHLVLIIRPLGKARQEIVHALVKGVIDMRTVLVDQDSGLVSAVIGIARNVATALQNGNTIADGLGKTAGANGTGISSTDDNHVVRAGVKAFRQA